jgi:hypothetical protein
MEMKVLALILLGSLATTAQAAEPRPYDGTPRPFAGIYETSYGMASARGERKLEALPDGRWQMENHAKLLMVDVAEKSTFTLRGDRVNSLNYEFINPLSKDRSMALDFDWTANTVTERTQKIVQKLEPNVYDKLSYQVQLQMDVCANPDQFTARDYTVVDRKRLKTYRVERVRREVQNTPAGVLDTIHLRQFRPDKPDGKDTLIWLAADWNCLLVRLDQRDGGDTISLKLVKAKLAGVEVKDKP